VWFTSLMRRGGGNKTPRWEEGTIASADPPELARRRTPYLLERDGQPADASGQAGVERTVRFIILFDSGERREHVLQEDHVEIIRARLRSAQAPPRDDSLPTGGARTRRQAGASSAAHHGQSHERGGRAEQQQPQPERSADATEGWTAKQPPAPHAEEPAPYDPWCKANIADIVLGARVRVWWTRQMCRGANVLKLARFEHGQVVKKHAPELARRASRGGVAGLTVRLEVLYDDGERREHVLEEDHIEVSARPAPPRDLPSTYHRPTIDLPCSNLSVHQVPAISLDLKS
jgi:hypothetical protein